MSPLDPIFQVNELPSQLFYSTETPSTYPLPQPLMSKATIICLNICRGDGSRLAQDLHPPRHSRTHGGEMPCPRTGRAGRAGRHSRALQPYRIIESWRHPQHLPPGCTATSLPAHPCLSLASSINLQLHCCVCPVQNNLLFQEEIAFLAPRNLFAELVGRFQMDFSVLLKFSLVIALCKAVKREEQELQDRDSTLTSLSYYYA